MYWVLEFNGFSTDGPFETLDDVLAKYPELFNGDAPEDMLLTQEIRPLPPAGPEH